MKFLPKSLIATLRLQNKISREQFSNLTQACETNHLIKNQTQFRKLHQHLFQQ
jgi:hypothetical protein